MTITIQIIGDVNVPHGCGATQMADVSLTTNVLVNALVNMISLRCLYRGNVW
jgi:hypothetical protein